MCTQLATVDSAEVDPDEAASSREVAEASMAVQGRTVLLALRCDTLQLGRTGQDLPGVCGAGVPIHLQKVPLRQQRRRLRRL